MRVTAIRGEVNDYAAEVKEKLAAAGFRVELDDRNEKIGYKIREAQLQKIPYVLVVGDREKEDGTVSVRSRKEENKAIVMPLDEFIAAAKKESDDKDL